MALDILNAKKVAENGLLSKIQIGGKTYEIKDLIARENLQALALLIDGLELNKADKEQVTKDIAAAIAGKADKDQVALDIAAAVANKADKTQVATDIADAVAAEAALREAADNALDGRLDKVETFFEVAEDEKLDAALDTLKEIQDYVNTHGSAADQMVKDIAANAKAIADEAADRAAADEVIDGRLDVIEAALGEGEGSVADQISTAKQEAIDAAEDYTDAREVEINKAIALKEDKANLKALAYKDSATGTVDGQTISGVKANGQSAGSITVELDKTASTVASTGVFTPAGSVNGGKVTAAGTVTINCSDSDAAAVLATADYQPKGSVSVVPGKNTATVITACGTPSFVEGTFTPATLNYAAADYSVAKEGIVGTVEGETLTFTAAGLEAISASKISSFNGGSKTTDTFTAGTCTSAEIEYVTGITSATFNGENVENAIVTGVTYKKHGHIDASFTGSEVAVTGASFTGSEGNISVSGACNDYSIKTAQFNPAAIELNVGDIAVAAKEVTVQ